MSGVIYHSYVGDYGLEKIKCAEVYTRSLKEFIGQPTSSEKTILKMIQWIPIIGSILSAYQLFSTITNTKFDTMAPEQQNTYKGYVVRLILSIACLGPLVMLADLVLTVARQFIAKPTQAAQSTTNTQTPPTVVVTG